MNARVWRDETLGAKYDDMEIPEDLREQAQQQRERLIETVAEFDDYLFESYIHGTPITNEDLRAGLRRAAIALKVFPVLCGSSFKNKGVQNLLDAVVDYLPSPAEVPPIQGTSLDGKQILDRPADDNAPFAALVFKIMTDPFVGQLAFMRVYSGSLASGDSVYNVAKGRRERVGRLLRMHANKQESVKEIFSGDIIAAVGLKTVVTGNTVCDEQHPVILEAIEFPTPVIQLAIEPKTKADQEKLGKAMGKLVREDPTLKVSTDPETGQTILAGMGELHLEIVVDRMLREFGVGANVGRPQVAYRETIRRPAAAEGRFVRQTGGHGQYGHVKIRIEPAPAGSGFEFISEISRGAVPRDFIPAVERGTAEALEGGILAGYPMSDVKVVLFDGSYHEVDSSEMAFKIAGSMAVKKASEKAHPVLLEPVMNVEVVVPEDYMGEVISDLNARRGKVEGMELRGTSQIIKALAPLSEMFGYATDLRSRTQGRGSFTMHFGRYEEAPASVSEEIIGKMQGRVAR
jgi:elongation factor G